MSHNKITVDNQAPNQAGEIPVNMSSYITESSPLSNQIIKYNGTSWINAASSSKSATAGLGLWFRNTASLSSSGSYSLNDYYMIIKASSYAYDYRASGFTYNNATTTNTPKNNANYLESIDIPGAGTYLCICSLALINNSFKVRWESNSGPFSAYCDINSSGNTNGSMLLGVLTTTGTDIVRVVIKEMPLGNVSLITNDTRGLSVHILKLS